MKEGVEGKGRTLIEIEGTGTVGHGMPAGHLGDRRLAGVQTDRDAGFLRKSLEEAFGLAITILLAHQGAEIGRDCHTLTVPLMAGQGS